jgi:lipopolysaccharide export system permease protein
MPIEDMWKIVKEAKVDMQKLFEEYEPRVWINTDNLLSLLKKDIKKDTLSTKDTTLVKNEPDSLRHLRAIEIVKNSEAGILTQINRMEIRREGLQRRIASYMVEIHKKLSTAVACVVFALIGAPLGIIARRGGIGPGTVYSLGFFAVYWVCLIGGENLADKLLVTPAIAMWACNVFIGTIGLFLTWRVSKK